jgi:hypothetical protein
MISAAFEEYVLRKRVKQELDFETVKGVAIQGLERNITLLINTREALDMHLTFAAERSKLFF